jgi:hypothetical protein
MCKSANKKKREKDKCEDGWYGTSTSRRVPAGNKMQTAVSRDRWNRTSAGI